VPHNGFVTLYLDKYRVETSRLRGWDYRLPGWYFETICTRNRACVLGCVVDDKMQLSAAGLAVQSEFIELPGHYDRVYLDAFIVMPNHVHAIVVIGGKHVYSPTALIVERGIDNPGWLSPQAVSLSTIIRSYKAGVTRRCRLEVFGNFAWQSGFYDHVLRATVSLDAVRDYILKNPANWVHDIDNPFRVPAG
jgi:putative transposase